MTVYKEQELRRWAGAKGIYAQSNPVIQLKGIAEECVEATEAYTSSLYDSEFIKETKKELGDIYVWWINACVCADIEPSEAIEAAYQKINKRAGEMKNGRFVKDV